MSFFTDYQYLHGQPASSAVIRAENEDFQVIEELGFEPEGEGEHVFLYIRKSGENTDWIARQLAGFAQLSPRDVSYAGKKDRHAVTEQWFCVRFPGKKLLNWKMFGGDNVSVLDVKRHPRKLRLGVLKGNRFRIKLREVSDMDALQERADAIRAGVPNYFGEQRFGHHYGNLDKGLRLIRGEYKERQRSKKGMYISAVRSWLFNIQLSERIAQGLWETPMPGDVFMLNGSQSCFCSEELDAEVQRRLEDGDIHLTAVMAGAGNGLISGEASRWQESVLESHEQVISDLINLGLKSERRSIRLVPQGLVVTPESDRECWVEFSLPAGSFATSILRELAVVSTAER